MAIKDMQDGLEAGRKDRKFAKKDGNKYKQKYFRSMAKVQSMGTSYVQSIYHKYGDLEPSNTIDETSVNYGGTGYLRGSTLTASVWAGHLKNSDAKNGDGTPFVWKDGKVYKINVDPPETPGDPDIVTAVQVQI